MKNTIELAHQKEQDKLVFNRLIVALKLGTTDKAILSYLNFLSQQLSIKSAHFTKVIPKFDLYTALFEREVQSLANIQALNENLIHLLKEKVSLNWKNEDQVDFFYHVKEGDPLEEILNQEKELEADLLVLGQQKASKHHGITAKNLIRQAKVPTLIVPEEAPAKISNILVPVDFSDHSELALQTAMRLYQSLEKPGKITLLHVYTTPGFSHLEISRNIQKFKQIIENNVREGCAVFLNNAIGEYSKLVDVALIEKVDHSPAPYIMDFAKKDAADLIVMGSKGHSKVHLLLMGSVTEKILTLNKSIPTLIVKQ